MQSNKVYSIQQTSDGGYILAGGDNNNTTQGYDIFLVKADSGGIEEWRNSFGTNGDDVAYSVQQTSDDGYIIVGQYNGSSDMYLIKTDSQGNEEWSKNSNGVATGPTSN